MAKAATTVRTTPPVGRYVVIGLIILTAFFASYRFASARTRSAANPASAYAGAVPLGTTSGGAGTPGAATSGGTGPGGAACACCGGASASAAPIEGTAKIDGAVQRITIDTSSGSYNPNTITLKAGVPAELTFGQASGCLGQVQSQDLGFYEDLTAGPKTVKLPALKAGTYQFSCGMQMVFGSIVVK